MTRHTSGRRPVLVMALLAGALSAGAIAQDAALIDKAKGIHDRVIKIDTHNDIDPLNFTPECNYTMPLTTQVNLPKMDAGDMDVTFMIAYVGQGPLTDEGYANAYRTAVAKFDAAHRLTEQIAPQRIGLALTPADVVRLHRAGKRIAVIGIENGYPIGTDIRRVKEFYDRGGRYMSLAHNGHSQLADSNNGEASNQWLYGGLSPLGKQVIAEMNRLGMMIDVSHPSKGANLQAIALSKAPVIASHSSVRTLANHSRNLDDEQLMALKQNGGVVQIVGYAGYVKVDSPERVRALAALRDEFGVTTAAAAGRGAGAAGGGRVGRGGAAAPGAAAAAPPPRPCPLATNPPAAGGRGGRGAAAGAAPQAPASLSPEQQAEYLKRLAAIDAKWPAAGRATVSDLVDHIDYAVKLIGIDHVGISSDFDGGGGITGWNGADEAFNVTLELVKRGYTEEQIGKIWGGNLLRVWAEVQRVAESMR